MVVGHVALLPSLDVLLRRKPVCGFEAVLLKGPLAVIHVVCQVRLPEDEAGVAKECKRHFWEGVEPCPSKPETS